MAPWLSIASRAKTEHDGTKRQAGGRRGANRARYAPSVASNMRTIAPGRASISSISPGAGKRRSEFCGHLGIAESVGVWFGDDDDVERWQDAGATMPKHLAHKTLYSIAHNGVPDSLARRHSEPRGPSRRGMSDYDQMRRMTAATHALQVQEIAAAPDAGGFRIVVRL